MNMQRQKKMHRILWLWWLGILGFSILLWTGSPSEADDPQGRSSSVIYQVTYQDKSIRNLPDPPDTNEGILMVMRITRTNSSLPRTETLSTGNQSMELLNPGRTQETQLHWNGQSWTPAVKIKPKPVTPSAYPVRPARFAPPKPEESSVNQNVIADDGVSPRARATDHERNPTELREKIQRIMELLSVSDRALRRAEQQVAMAANAPEAMQNAEQSLVEARQAHQEAMTNIIQLKSSLGLRRTRKANLTAVAQTPTATPQPPYDPNRPITPPPVLNTNIAANGYCGGYGWPGACGWPCFGGNVMIQSQQPNPDFDAGPRVIIREQE